MSHNFQMTNIPIAVDNDESIIWLMLTLKEEDKESFIGFELLQLYFNTVQTN